MTMIKKEYVSPEWEITKIGFTNQLMASDVVEIHSSHIDDDGDWGDDPFFG